MDPKIIFMGTSYFSVLSLEKILKNKYIILGIVTIVDRFSSKKKGSFVESKVKKYARLHALSILQSDDLRNLKFLNILKKWSPELLIIIAFRVLPKVIWNFLPFGNFNLHPSLLPNYRGSCPIQWAIINNEIYTGVSTYIINESIDMGKTLLQRKINIEKKENAGSLAIRLAEIGAYLVVDTIKSYNCLLTKKQSTNLKFKLAPKLLRFYSKINWKRTINYIYNIIKGNSPFPGAWCIIANNVFKIFRANYTYENNLNVIGTIKKNTIYIKNGNIFITEFQLEGKIPLIIKDILSLNIVKFLTDVCL